MQTFYTTPEQEEELERIYEQKVKEKQIELDKETLELKRTNPTYIVKYTAYAHVDKEPRTFKVRKVNITFNNQIIPLTHQEGGQTYFPDKRFQECVEEFIQNHPEYDITFYVTGKYGPCMNYIADGFVCFLRAVTGERLFVENDDAYDIGCC